MLCSQYLGWLAPWGSLGTRWKVSRGGGPHPNSLGSPGVGLAVLLSPSSLLGLRGCLGSAEASAVDSQE